MGNQLPTVRGSHVWSPPAVHITLHKWHENEMEHIQGSGAVIHIGRDDSRKFHVHCEDKEAAWLPGPWWKDLPGSRYRQIVAQCEQALANVQKGLSNKRDGLPQKSWFLSVELFKACAVALLREVSDAVWTQCFASLTFYVLVPEVTV